MFVADRAKAQPVGTLEIYVAREDPYVEPFQMESSFGFETLQFALYKDLFWGDCIRNLLKFFTALDLVVVKQADRQASF